MNAPAASPELAHNISRLSHMELPGAGQVYIRAVHLHRSPDEFGAVGTSIIDIVGPPQAAHRVADILDDPNSHSHKARVDRRHHDRQQRANGAAHRPQGRQSSQPHAAALEQRSGATPTAGTRAATRA